MDTAAAKPPKPASGVIQLSERGAPWIRGFRCSACGAVVAEATMCCRQCACRQAPTPFHAAETGRLHAWSVVMRSYPGVATPFISAIVDLDNGLTLKGTLRDLEPQAARAGLPVKLVFDDAGGARDAEGGAYVGYHFVPTAGAAP